MSQTATFPSQRRESLQSATRAELIAYLESWGFMCYDDETTRELRLAALDNYDTEGA